MRLDATRADTASFGTVVRDTFATLSRHPVHILACGGLCFAGVSIAGALLYAGLMMRSLFGQAQMSYFNLAAEAFYLQMHVQAVIGAVAFLLGRGAITWLAISPTPHPTDGPTDLPSPGLRAAFAAALSRWKPLLLSHLLYGALITLSLIGITWMLRELRMDISNYRWVRREPGSIVNMTLVRAIGQLTPDPGSPFTELYAATRYTLSRQSFGTLGSVFPRSSDAVPLHLVIAGLAGASLAFLTETLLCLRTATIMATADTRALGWLVPSLRLSARNFWRVARWRWGMRLVIIALYTACVILPNTLHQSVVVSMVVGQVGSYWPYAANAALQTIGTALVGTMLIAFGVTFEARLYSALSREVPPGGPASAG